MTETSGRNIVILTGAGISKESGLDTFRDAGGIWSKVRIEDVATPEAFASDPARVHDFYNARRAKLAPRAPPGSKASQASQASRASRASGGIEPNAAHLALARLEAEWPGGVLIVTQNIDDLHERAGSRNIIHMHGELLKARCGTCGGVFGWSGDLGAEDACAGCGGKGGLRPHVVWFGEMPLEMERIYAALDRCRMFLSIGTSGNVYPAAGFVAHVGAGRGGGGGRGGAHTVELNIEPSEGASHFAETHYGPATKLVPAYVKRILDRGWQAGPGL